MFSTNFQMTRPKSVYRSVSKYLYRKYRVIMRLMGYDHQIRRFIHDVIEPEDDVHSIMEVGCGTGAAGRALHELFPQSEILFTDYNYDLLVKLKESLAHRQQALFGVADVSVPAQVQLTGGQTIVLPNSAYDYICAGANIGYSSCPESTVVALYDMLKPGGRILNLEMNLGFWGRLISGLYNYPVLTPREVTEVVRQRGAVVTVTKVPWLYFPLNLTRVFITIQKPIRE